MPRKKKKSAKELPEELDVFDEMLDPLVDISKRKSILTPEAWEGRIKKSREFTSYRELEFGGNQVGYWAHLQG